MNQYRITFEDKASDLHEYTISAPSPAMACYELGRCDKIIAKLNDITTMEAVQIHSIKQLIPAPINLEATNATPQAHS